MSKSKSLMILGMLAFGSSGVLAAGTFDRSGTWSLTPSVSYQCATGVVNLNFASIQVDDNNPNITVSPVPTADPPGTMTGSFSDSDSFIASRFVAGTCNETYTFSGTFSGESSLSATFTAAFSGSCLDCTTQVLNLTGTLPTNVEVPTLGTWGFVVLVLATVTAGVLVIRCRSYA